MCSFFLLGELPGDAAIDIPNFFPIFAWNISSDIRKAFSRFYAIPGVLVRSRASVGKSTDSTARFNQAENASMRFDENLWWLQRIIRPLRSENRERKIGNENYGRGFLFTHGPPRRKSPPANMRNSTTNMQDSSRELTSRRP